MTSIDTPVNPGTAINEAVTVRADYDQAAKAIRDDRDLSDEARARKLAEVHQSTSERLQGLQQRYQETITAEQRRLELQVFGNPDADGTTSDYRAALDRAETLEGDDDARKLIQRASDTGDRVLARAVLYTAMKRGWVGAVRTYKEQHPKDSEALSALLDFNQRHTDRSARLGASMAFSRPPSPRGR